MVPYSRAPNSAVPGTSHMTPSDDRDLLDELDLGAEVAQLRLPPEADYIDYTRDLTAADLELLGPGKPPEVPPVAPPLLQRIHSSHHALARCVAMGLKNTQVALVTGYSPVRISQLLQDPTFQALVEDYRAEARGAFADLGERMANVSLDAIELLHERLHQNPDGFSVPMLLDVVKAFADRTGHGPGAEVTFKMDPNMIDRPPRESFEDWERRRKLELDITPVAVPPKQLN